MRRCVVTGNQVVAVDEAGKLTHEFFTRLGVIKHAIAGPGPISGQWRIVGYEEP